MKPALPRGVALRRARLKAQGERTRAAFIEAYNRIGTATGAAKDIGITQQRGSQLYKELVAAGAIKDRKALAALEHTVEAYFDQVVRRMGGETRKVVFPGRRGAPDRWALLPGYNVLAELKRPKGGVVEAHQKREHERLRAAGVEVVVLHTREAIDAWARGED